MTMRPTGDSTVQRWRSLSAETVLVALAEHAKMDPTFIPQTRGNTSRWHASAGGFDFELVLTGPKFWDTRKQVGGGGAVDLVIHLFGGDFKAAAAKLKAAKL